MTPEDERRLRRMRAVARAWDSAFRVPGTRRRVGLDGIVGLIPGAGDVAGAAVATWIVWQAKRLGASRGTLARMALNVAVDFAVGSIPLLGDLFDLGFKANLRNVALLERRLRP